MRAHRVLRTPLCLCLAFLFSPPPLALGDATAPAHRQLDAREAPARSAPPGQSWQRLSSLVLAAGAGVALGTAVTFHVAREDRARQHNQYCFPYRLSSCTDMESRVQRAQTGALVGYLVSALLAGGSTYFYLSAPESRPDDRLSSRLAGLSCNPLVSGQGLSCGARF